MHRALSALIFSSQGIAPQNGARMMLDLSRQRQNSWKSLHVAMLFMSSSCTLHADNTALTYSFIDYDCYNSEL